MTSKSLFFKLLKEDLKRRIWTIALASLVFFLSLPVVCAMVLGNTDTTPINISSRERIINEIINQIGPQNVLIIIISCIGAIICGLSGFFYLHSRKKVDLYHSIPVRRELLFAISYINGLVIYVIPYVINVILCFVILQINQLLSVEIVTVSISAIGINLLFYSLIYTISVIAVMLTGNLIISFFGTAVFLLYGPMLMVLKGMYFSSFFKTYYAYSDLNTQLQFLSPVGIYITITNKMSSGMNESIFGSILSVIIVTILLIGFAVFLYKKRPSEAASKAMSFSFSRPVIKFLLVIPLTLGGGIIFRDITNRSSNGWFLFGLIFSLIIIYAIIEIIYNFDIRSAFGHKKDLMGCAIGIAIIASIFQFDLLHYDSFIPEKNKVKSMSVAISGIEDNLQYTEIGSLRDRYNYIGSAEYQLKYMKLTEIDSAYGIAKLGVRGSKESDTIKYSYSVKYTLKSGREVYRTYQIATDESYDMMKAIFASAEYKEAHYPIYQWKAEQIGWVSCYNTYDNKEFSLDINEKKQLLDIYKEELKGLTMEELSVQYPLATLSIQIYQNAMNYYVYPSFEKTIDFLKDHGFDATKKVDIKDIKRIEVSNYQAVESDSIYDEYKNEIASTAMKSLSATYIDENEIKEIFPNLIDRDYSWSNRSIIYSENSIDVIVVIQKDEYGNEETYSYSFKQGMIPEFVKSDIEYN